MWTEVILSSGVKLCDFAASLLSIIPFTCYLQYEEEVGELITLWSLSQM